MKTDKSKDKDSKDKPVNIVWHKQTERILKDWSELSSCYRYMHDIAYGRFKTKNLWFTLPVIILTTLTGTANFSQSSFKETSFFEYVPLMIGGVNLVSGMISTIHQTLKYSTLEEGHRISAMAFGKLSRNIRVELNLPVKERSTSGSEFLFSIRSELDRLLEQSPQIPTDIIKAFEKKFKDSNLYKPEIININGVEIYEDNDKVSELLGQTANDLKTKLNEPLNNYERNKKMLNDELNVLAANSSAKKGREIFENKSRELFENKSNELFKAKGIFENKVKQELENKGSELLQAKQQFENKGSELLNTKEQIENTINDLVESSDNHNISINIKPELSSSLIVSDVKVDEKPTDVTKNTVKDKKSLFEKKTEQDKPSKQDGPSKQDESKKPDENK